jgi:hypothetical protein
MTDDERAKNLNLAVSGLAANLICLLHVSTKYGTESADARKGQIMLAKSLKEFAAEIIRQAKSTH